MLDPILVNKINGPNGAGQAGRPLRAVEERSKARDHGTVAKNPDSIHYKGRSRHTKKDTLKTVERATPTYRPCFHLDLVFFILSISLVTFDLNSSIVLTLNSSIVSLPTGK